MLTHADAFDHHHSRLDQILRQNVVDGLVNYSALKEAPAALGTYLTSLDQVSEAQFSRWSQPERLAFLINLYNASTLQLVASNYPVRSIKKIGGYFGNPWKLPSVRLFGQGKSLDDIEHGWIRPQFKDPRTHFALVCAARGCPPLRSEAYTAEKLENQLNDQGRRFLAQTTKNRIDPTANRLYLSPIFKWYHEDFVNASGSVIGFIQPFLSPEDRLTVTNKKLVIEFTDYDWSLNEAPAGKRLPESR
jgi:hypothetical protein